MNFQRFFLSFLFLICAFVANANEPIGDRSWVEDPSGKMTLEEVKTAEQNPLEGKFFSRGYSQSTFWVRIRIDPSRFKLINPDDRLIIRIRPPYIDNIELFDPLDNSEKKRITGQSHDWKHDELQSLNLNFVIPVGKEPRDIWLRIRTDKSTMAVIELMSEAEARKIDRSQEFWTMLYISLLVVCMGWGALSWLGRPDKLVGIYVIRQVLAIGYAVCSVGYLRIFASNLGVASWTDIIFLNIVWVFVAFVVWFDSQLLKEFKPNRWLLKVFYVLSFGLVIEWALLIFDNAFMATMVNSYIVLAAIPLVLIGVLTTSIWKEAHLLPEDQRPVISKGLLFTIYAVTIVAVLVNRLPFMGLIEAHEGFLYLNLVYAALSSVLMMFLILVRSARISKRQQKIQQHLAVVEKEIDQERMYRAEQSDFLKMLAHEMRTLLSVVRISVGKDQLPEKANNKVDRAVNEMNSLIERLLEVERFNENEAKVNLTEFEVAQLTRELVANLAGDRLVNFENSGSTAIRSDIHFVRIVISNLIDNAFKYGANDKSILIKVNGYESFVELVVQNQVGAAGLPDKDKIFQKYYRSQGARERAGSGLGLYLVKTLMNKLKGHIDYDESNNVVKFSVRFPR